MMITGTATLPDGRLVMVSLNGYTERDTGAFIQTGLDLKWPDGRYLTADEYNQEVAPGYCLHEWAAEKVKVSYER